MLFVIKHFTKYTLCCRTHLTTLSHLLAVGGVTCILEEEVATAIKELKNNKAEGIDEIPAELLKCMGNMAVKVFAHLCQKIYETGKWTADFLQTVIIPLLRNVVISGQSACWGMQQKY